MLSIKKKKVVVLVISGLITLVELVDTFYLCSSVYNETCFTTKYDDFIRVTLFWIFISLFIVSIFTFFISDKIFKKWFTFTLWWFGFTIFFIILAPTHLSGGMIAFGPTEESVLVWMSSLFVIISIIVFIWMTIKEKNK